VQWDSFSFLFAEERYALAELEEIFPKAGVKTESPLVSHTFSRVLNCLAVLYEMLHGVLNLNRFFGRTYATENYMTFGTWKARCLYRTDKMQQ
jgi:hypothetical protein